MLRLTKLCLSNFCQYSSLELDIDTGLMAVCGKNGSGKTTLLRAIVYAMTGVVDGSWGTQQDLQKDGEITPGYASVTLVNKSAGYSLEVTRYTTSNVKYPDRVLKISTDGGTEEVALRRKDVDAYLSAAYGIPCSLLAQICWGRQGQLDMLLTSTAAHISTFLSSVFNTSYVETIRTKIKAQLDTISDLPDIYKDLVSKHTETLKQVEDKIPILESKLADTEARIAYKRDSMEALASKLAEVSEPIAKWEKAYTKATADLSNTTSQIANIDHNISKLSEGIDQQWLDTAFSASDITELELLVKESNEAVDNIQRSYASKELEYKAALSKVDEVKSAIETLVAAYEAQLKALEVDKSTCTCELCGANITDIDSYALNRNGLLLNGHSVEEYKANYNNQLVNLKSVQDRYTKSAENLNQELNQLYAEIPETVAVLNAHIARLTAAKAVVAINEQIELKKPLQERLNKLNLILQKLDKNKPTNDSASLAETLRQVNLQITELSDLQVAVSKELAEAKAQKKSLEEDIELNTDLASKREVNEAAKNILIILREALDKTHAQAIYLVAKIDAINAKLAHFMELTGMPFTLELNNTTRLFQYTTDMNFLHPASHLSGAQKNISALALQMAIFEVIQPNINLFLVDEPSESLDVENKAIMADMFQRMNNMLPTIDGTMLIVTRDTQIIEACNNRLDITEE